VRLADARGLKNDNLRAFNASKVESLSPEAIGTASLAVNP
jgi:hypothetical protein